MNVRDTDELDRPIAPGSIAATVFPANNRKYLSTDLLGEEPEGPNFLSPDVELLGLGVFKRVCRTCCDPEECAQNRPLRTIDDREPMPRCPRRC